MVVTQLRLILGVSSHRTRHHHHKHLSLRNGHRATMKTIFLWSRILIFVHSNHRKVVSKGGSVEETLTIQQIWIFFFCHLVFAYLRTVLLSFLSHWELAEPVFWSKELSCLPSNTNAWLLVLCLWLDGPRQTPDGHNAHNKKVLILLA